MEFASHATFAFDAWPCGLYATDTFQGSRAGQTAVAAWTTMRLLGREGYLDIAHRMRETTDRLVEGAGQCGVTPLAKPEAGVLVLTSTDVDIFAVSEGLNRRDFPHCTVLEPEAIHFVMNPVETDEPVEALLEALADAVEDAAAGRVSRAGSRTAYA